MRTEYHEFQDPCSRWVVVNTHPHREALAIEHLNRQEFSTYCPMLRKRLKLARRPQDVLRPLFPGYLFVRVPLDRVIWRPILSTIGVRSLIRFGERLAYIEDDFIYKLKCREIDGAVSRPPTAYNVGDRVVLAGGPLDGLIATILSMDDKDRLVVLMDLLNQSVKVKVESRQVSPLVSV